VGKIIGLYAVAVFERVHFVEGIVVHVQLFSLKERALLLHSEYHIGHDISLKATS